MNYSTGGIGLGIINELIVIENILHEHDAIREHVRAVSGLMDGWEEVEQGTLDEPDARVIPAVLTGHISLKQTMGYLDDGLHQHFSYEEEIMPGLIGNPLMEAVEIEHQEIQRQLQEINFILLNVNLPGLLANLDYLKMIVNNLRNLVESHCSTEDVMLILLKRRFI